MGVGAVLKLLHVYLLASVKYFFTFPYALIIGLDFTQTIIVVTIGGISGFFFFYYLSGTVIRNFQKYKKNFLLAVRSYIRIDLGHLLDEKQPDPKKYISKRTRKIVKLRKSYGLWGIIVMTPILLSIPLGAFLLSKYYSKRKNVFAYMMISIVGWALVFSTIVIILPKPM